MQQRPLSSVDPDIVRAQLANAVLHACSVLMTEAPHLIAYPMLGRLAESEVVFEMRSNQQASRLYAASFDPHSNGTKRFQRFSDSGQDVPLDAFDIKVSQALERGLEQTVRAYLAATDVERAPLSGLH